MYKNLTDQFHLKQFELSLTFRSPAVQLTTAVLLFCATFESVIRPQTAHNVVMSFKRVKMIKSGSQIQLKTGPESLEGKNEYMRVCME